MSTTKKLLIFCIFLILISINSKNSIAQAGCCTNPGASALTCYDNAVQEYQCCPTPQTDYAEYYKSAANPSLPQNYEDCKTNFFFPGKQCSEIESCATGCCCSALGGGTVSTQSQCQGENLRFEEGATNCDVACPQPQCSDGIDNDGDGCIDYEFDAECANADDNDESPRGACRPVAASCNDPAYTPKLSNFRINPVKGQKKFSLEWQAECGTNIVSYEVFRCKDPNCESAELIGTATTPRFEDASDELLFDTAYTYQIKANYNLQQAKPTITNSARLGNIECLGQISNEPFCIHESYYSSDLIKNYLTTKVPRFTSNFEQAVRENFNTRFNKAFSCDNQNLLQQRAACNANQVCIIDSSNNPSCIAKSDCYNPSANPFGMFYTQQNCELSNSQRRYCFYDRSYTTINSCFSCITSMSCYDYKSGESCERDNCGVRNCAWKPISDELNTGVCIATSKSNCQWCDKAGTESLGNINSYNKVFDLCTREKSDKLSQPNYRCLFVDGISKSCDDVVCSDYRAAECSNNVCGIKINERNACKNIGGRCAKDADNDNQDDCANANNRGICEADYFPPDTTITPVINSGKTESLDIQIYDKTSQKSPLTLVTSNEYVTFLCLEQCSNLKVSTNSRSLIIDENLKLVDTAPSSPRELFELKNGLNRIVYYSQDPSKNVEESKTIEINADDVGRGPRVFGIEVTNGREARRGVYYTNSNKPAIRVRFLNPAIIFFAKLENTVTKRALFLQGNANLESIVTLNTPDVLEEGRYTLQLNARNRNNVIMDPPFSATIVVDTTKPKLLQILPIKDVIVTTSNVEVKLTFDEIVNLTSVIINSLESRGNFTTQDNKVFTATMTFTDGKKDLAIVATDLAGNQLQAVSSFVVDALPTSITLTSPRFGTASDYTFDFSVETDNDAECRYELDNDFDYEAMDRFSSTGGTIHTATGFNKIPNGDSSTHKLYVKCKTSKYGVASKSFDLNVDTTPPQLKKVFAFPNPIVEIPSSVSLSIESDEPVICKFSSSSVGFNSMEGTFEGFVNNTFRNINRQEIDIDSEGDFVYYVACKNKAELISDVKEIPLKVDLSIPLRIISHTPEAFNSTSVTLAFETNKKSQCKYSSTDRTAQTGEIIGVFGYTHAKQITMSEGRHTLYVVCKDSILNKFSDVAEISFVVDTSPPRVTSVDDTSTLENYPEKTCNTDRLRVRWTGEDPESGVKEYSYSLFKRVDNTPLLENAKSTVENRWLWAENLRLQDNTEYYFKVKAKNFVGKESDSVSSDGVTVDTAVCKPPPKCGDGKINMADEQCDGATFGVINSCTQYTNFIGGSLACTNDCKLDTSGCTKAPDCGNGVIDPSEACDGTIFGSIKTCSDYNPSFTGGSLKCTSTCQLDTSACIEAPKCGNKAIDKGESCDGNNLGPLSGECTDYNPSTFSGGTLSCSNNCQLDTSKCQGVQGTCGDGVLNIGEACDGASFGTIKSCTDYSSSFSEGTLACTSTCQLDTSGCKEKEDKCGNKVINQGENCDSDNLGPLSGECIDYSSDFKSGNLKCSNCKLDTSECTKAPTCGNKRLDTGEICDGDNFGSLADLSCTNYGGSFVGGSLTCVSCRISTKNCTENATVAVTCKDRGDCELNAQCSDDNECRSRFCLNSKCAQPACNDNIKNQDETDVDCGGSCNKCQNNRKCFFSSDCQSNFCSSLGSCKSIESCSDRQLTPGETDVDCGGACPTKCPEGSSCITKNDCDIGLQCISSICKRSEIASAQDSDGDGIPDDWEIQHGLNPNDPNDADLDSDDDGLTNYEEFNVQDTYGKSTDPNNSDTDGDTFSDKKEIDKGSSPVDAEDFPKSNLAKILLFIFGIAVLLSGFGYLAYRVMSKRKESIEFAPQKQVREGARVMQPRIILPKQKEDFTRVREALRKKEEEREKAREKLFEAFGKEETKEIKTEKQETKAEKKEMFEKELAAAKIKKPRAAARKQEKVRKIPKKKPAKPKKQKEDVFLKLKEIAKETKKRKK